MIKYFKNSYLGLPEGMGSNTSEFQQALRYQLGASISKLIALLIIAPLTALAAKIVWSEKVQIDKEVQDRQVSSDIM